MAERKTDPARARPLTLEFLRDLGALEDFSPPTAPFDAEGTWVNSYRLWLVQQFLGCGSLRLRREPIGADGVRLGVDLAIAEHGGYLRRTRATLECANGALCTPRSWALESQSLDLDDRPAKATRFSEAGTVRDGVVETRIGDRTRRDSVPQPVTSNWSLFEAVQRLDGEKTPPLKFAMLEEMDLLKPDQRLEFREAKAFEVNGRTLRLRGYQQIGRGILPWQYWVDAAGRLLFAFSGVRAWVYAPDAERRTQEKLDAARGRMKRRRRTQ